MLEDDRGFINPKNTMDIIEEVEFASRPYLAFFKVICERDEAQIGWTAASVLVYDKWKMFCEANDLMDMHSYSDHKTFTREFKRYIKRIKVKEHIFYGFRLRKGVELKSDVAQIG
jgi:phage/plasmid-associated DNA primase